MTWKFDAEDVQECYGVAIRDEDDWIVCAVEVYRAKPPTKPPKDTEEQEAVAQRIVDAVNHVCPPPPPPTDRGVWILFEHILRRQGVQDEQIARLEREIADLKAQVQEGKRPQEREIEGERNDQER